MHDNLIREREGGRLPFEVRLGSQVDIVTQLTKWTRNINLTLNIGLRVSGLCFGFSGSPCFPVFLAAHLAEDVISRRKSHGLGAMKWEGTNYIIYR